MAKSDGEGVAAAFIERINAHDVAGLSALMTQDHTFTDALGNTISGKATMTVGWQHFFAGFPEYWIKPTAFLERGDTVAVFGSAGGAWSAGGKPTKERWKVSAAWRARVENGRVAEWQVYCDTAWATGPKSATA